MHVFSCLHTLEGFAEFTDDGSFLWYTTSITYLLNDKTDLILFLLIDQVFGVKN